ncbi:hypothetical protein JKY72_04065 [Candidatus Gracilibacteria bacterium]|nr:hypothetical protein [Candidatus Gracilibacteria bacterium]
MNASTIASNSSAEDFDDYNEFRMLFQLYEPTSHLKYMNVRTSKLFETAVREGISTHDNWPLVCLDIIEYWPEYSVAQHTEHYIDYKYADMQTLAKLSGMIEYNDNDAMNTSILRYIREHLTLDEIAERPTSQFLCRVLANAHDKTKYECKQAYALAQARLGRLTGGCDAQRLIVAMLAYLHRTGQRSWRFTKLCERATTDRDMYLSTATIAYDLIFKVSSDKNMAMFMFTPDIIDDVTPTNLSIKLVYILHSVFLSESEILDMPVLDRNHCQLVICAHCQSFCNNAVCSKLDSTLTFCEHCPESYRSRRPSEWSFTLNKLTQEVQAKTVAPRFGDYECKYHFRFVRGIIMTKHSMSFIIRVMLLRFNEHGVSETDPETIERYRDLSLGYMSFPETDYTEFVHRIQLRAPIEADSDFCEKLKDMITMSGGSAQVREYITAQQLLHENWLDLFNDDQVDGTARDKDEFAFLFVNQDE